MSADNISTRNVWPYYDSSNVQAATAKPKSETLGKDEFLRILNAASKSRSDAAAAG